VLYMGNTSTVDVKGIGQVELAFTSVKSLTLNDAFFVPEVRKNLVSSFLFNKFGSNKCMRPISLSCQREVSLGARLCC